MNISLYTSTCTRKPGDTWKNWNNWKNPPQGLGGLHAVFRVIPVIPVFPGTPRRACVVPTTNVGSRHSEEPKHLQARLCVGSGSGYSSYSSFSRYPQACVRGAHDRSGSGPPVGTPGAIHHEGNSAPARAPVGGLGKS
jgi:hypothetical protein